MKKNIYIDVAKDLAAIGIQPVFLKSFSRDENGKKTVQFEPKIRWRENPSIKEQLKVLPNPKGLAIRTGEDSNITCIDIDDLTSFEELDEKYNLLEHAKMIVETHNGLHLYYDYTPDLKQTQQASIKIDIRSDGGLLFFPPTPSYNFHDYEGDGIVPTDFIEWFNAQKSSAGESGEGTSPEHIVDEKSASDKSYLNTNYGRIISKLGVNFHLVDGRKSAAISLFEKLYYKGYNDDTADDMVVYWNEFNHPPLPITGRWSLDSCKTAANKYFKGTKGKTNLTLKESKPLSLKNPEKKERAKVKNRRFTLATKDGEKRVYPESILEKPWDLFADTGNYIYKQYSGGYIVKIIAKGGHIESTKEFKSKQDIFAYIDGEIFNKFNIFIEYEGKDGNLYTKRASTKSVNLSYFYNVEPTFAPDIKKIEWWEKDAHERRFNMYNKKRLLHLEPQEGVELDPLLKNFLMNLAGDNEYYFEWLINWLACNYQLKNKAEKTPLFISASGVGKNTLADLLKRIYTQEYIHMSANTNILTSNFNAELKDKLYYFMDEFRIDDDVEYDTLKAYTANNSDFALTIKGKDTKMYPLYANFVLYSNNDIPMKIKELDQDRRFNVFKPGKPLIQCDWWNSKSHSELMGKAEHFALFLASYKIDTEFRDKQLKTERWKALIADSQPEYKQFVDALLNKDYKWFDDTGVTALPSKPGSVYTLGDELDKTFNKDGILTALDCRKIFEGVFDTKFSPKKAREYGLPNSKAIKRKYGAKRTVVRGYKLFDITPEEEQPYQPKEDKEPMSTDEMVETLKKAKSKYSRKNPMKLVKR